MKYIIPQNCLDNFEAGNDQNTKRGVPFVVHLFCGLDISLYKDKVYTDQQTGKTFNRPRYQMVKEEILESGDVLIVTEVDRLGRNKKDTLKELQLSKTTYCRYKREYEERQSTTERKPYKPKIRTPYPAPENW